MSKSSRRYRGSFSALPDGSSSVTSGSDYPHLPQENSAEVLRSKRLPMAAFNHSQATTEVQTGTILDSEIRLSDSDELTTPVRRTYAPPPMRVELENRLIAGLHKWEGTIIEIVGDVFSAELIPLDHEGPELVANFDLKHLADSGEVIEVGDMFYLTTRIVLSGRQKIATSRLQLRRLGNWTREELDAARTRARVLAEKLDLDAD